MKTAAACALGLALMAVALWQRPDNVDDFRAFYRGARLAASHQSVYAQPLENETKKSYLPYLRLPSYAVLLEPLATLPYRSARGIWTAMSFLALGGCIRLAPFRRERLALALACSFPLAYSFVLGQDIGFVVLIIFAAIRIAATGREFIAGLIASLIGIKISYLPAVAIVFLAKSRRGTMGLATGLAAQIALSFAAGGANWPSEYLAVLRSPLLDPEPRRMPNLRAVFASLSLPQLVFGVCAVLVLVFLWIGARRMHLPRALILALPIGLLASPHAYVYDAVVLIPLFVLADGNNSLSGLLARVGLTPFPYLLLVMDRPAFVLSGSLLIVASTLGAAARFYREREHLLHWSFMAKGATVRAFGHHHHHRSTTARVPA